MGKRGRYAKGEERREEILATALEVIAERGFHGTTLGAVGRELDIAPAHILYYFGSRESLLRAVVERWDSRYESSREQESLLARFPEVLRANQRIRGIVHLYLAFAIEAVQPGHAARPYFRERFAGVIDQLSDALKAGQARGEIIADLEPHRTARRLVAMADGLQLQWLLDEEFDPAAELELAISELMVDTRVLLGQGDARPTMAE